MRGYLYNVYGLTFDSELELPELESVVNQTPEIRIRIGKVPKRLQSPISTGILFQSSPMDFLFSMKGIADYRVQNGNLITIDPVSNVNSDEVRLFLLSSSLGALLHQRKLITLHGSAIGNNKESIVIAGKSASGKSSLAFALSKKGYQLISDDVSVITENNAKRFYLQPGIVRVKLWKDVIDYYDLKDTFKKVRPGINKFWVSPNDTIKREPNEIQKIIILSTKNTKGFSVNIVKGNEKFNLIQNQFFRKQYIKDFDISKSQFFSLSKLANQITLYKIERPSSPLLINELVAFLMKEVLD